MQDDYGNEIYAVLNNYLSLGNGSNEGIIFPSENNITVETPCEINLNNSTCVNNIPANHENDAYSILNKLKLKNINRIVLAQLNINSIRNKIDMLSDLVVNKIDILLISETKLDESFPSVNFSIPGFSKPYRRDRSSHGGHGGGLLLYIREDIPSKMLFSIPIPHHYELFFVEINFHKKKWLIGNIYIPCKNQVNEKLYFLSKCMDHYYTLYDNVILLGDFNSEVSEISMNNFCQLYNLRNLVKEPTCFKNLQNPSNIDLMLTNKCRSFQNTTVIETGISDFHKMTATVLKTCYKKEPPKIISYRDFKMFSNVIFRREMISMLGCHDINNINYGIFENIFMTLIDKYVPLKCKYIRANEAPFMNKEIRKAIMTRSRLKNRFYREKTEESNIAYKIQRNKCTALLRKSKKRLLL